MLGSGRVFFPSEAPLLADFLNELAAFPASKFDDQIDSTTQALEYDTGFLCTKSIYDFL
jgi:predicted phage terminase large subunit-like protein